MYEFSAEIVPGDSAQVLMSRDGEIVIFDRPDAQKTEVGIALRVKTEFKPNGSGYFEVTHPDAKEKTYQWESGADSTIEGRRNETATIKTAEKTWGREFEIKVDVRTLICGKKRGHASCTGKKKAVAPKITVKSATFSETGGGNGFTILDKLRGKPIRVPEYVRDDKAKDEDKSPIGFYAGQKPVYQVEFDVQPASLANVTAKCEGGIFTTEERVLKVDGAGGARDKVEGSRVIAQESKSGSGAKDQVKWSFSVYGGVPLSYKENMNIYRYYVLLDKGGRQDKPWKNLLKAAFDLWGAAGATKHEELVDHLSEGIARSSQYNHDGWDPKIGKTTSLYVDQQKNPMPLAVGDMVDAFCKPKQTAKIICVEAAGLAEYAAHVLGPGGVTSRGVNWTETGEVLNPATGQKEEKTWSNGHGYCLHGGFVHDPVPGGRGPTKLNEENFIKQKLKKNTDTVKRSEFTDPRTLTFKFD